MKSPLAHSGHHSKEEGDRETVGEYGMQGGLVREQEGVHVENFSEARRLVEGCSVVVGMHPDQAAQAMIDFAVLNNKPFACVPCCVFSRCVTSSF